MKNVSITREECYLFLLEELFKDKREKKKKKKKKKNLILVVIVSQNFLNGNAFLQF